MQIRNSWVPAGMGADVSRIMDTRHPVGRPVAGDSFLRFGSLKRPLPGPLPLNKTGIFYTPSHRQYYHQWLWDSAFHAIILSHYDTDEAKKELSSLFDEQWDNGMVAQIRFNPSNRIAPYRPNAEDWGTGRPTSGITQPPLIGSALKVVFEKSGDRQFLAETFDKAMKFQEWMKAEREIPGTKLIGIVHPWESGTDNSPIFDGIRDRLVAGTFANVEVPPRADKLNVDEAQRPLEEDYKVYWGLLRQFRALGWDQKKMVEQSPFLVAEPLFNSLWIKSNEDMADLADALGRPADARKLRGWAEASRKDMRKYMWNRKDGFFYAYDFRAQSQIKVKTVNGLIPIYARVPTRHQARRLVREHLANPEAFYGKHGVPSTAFNESTYDPKRYWRGPVWINTQWLLVNGLRDYSYDVYANELTAKAKALTGKAGFREYYHPETGEGLGAKDFSWSTLTEIL